MKNVVITIPQVEYTTIREVSTYRYYGVIIGYYKGFITQEDTNCGNFIVLCCSELTIGNRWTAFESSTLQGTIKKLLEGDYPVVEFESEKELFTWLGQP